MKQIYVASSWRNKYQPEVVSHLRSLGHEVYDFRNPRSGGPILLPNAPAEGFGWKQIDPGGILLPSKLRETLRHPIAQLGFTSDKQGMDWANTCVCVLPCGRSAHLEAGWMGGEGKKVLFYLPEIFIVCPKCEGARYFDGDHHRNVRCDTCDANGALLEWADKMEPELMYLLAGSPDSICVTMDEVVERLK